MLVDSQKRHVRWGVSLLGALIFILAWHGATDVFELVNPFVLPSPIGVYDKFRATESLIYSSLWTTLTIAMVSFVLSLVLAILCAILLTWNNSIENALMPFIVATNSVPRVSLAPVFIFYVGPFESQYLLAAWVAFFPMLINTFEGLSNIDEDLEKLLDSLDASQWQRYKWVRIPNALPFIFDGMKLGITLAIVGTIVVEYVATGSGIGTLAALALGNYDTALGIAVVVIVGLFTVSMFFLIFLIQIRVVHWKESSLYEGA